MDPLQQQQSGAIQLPMPNMPIPQSTPPTPQQQTPIIPEETAPSNPLNSVQPERADPLNSVPLDTKPIDTRDDEAINRRSSMYALGKLSDLPVDPSQDSSLWDLYSSASSSMRETMGMLGDDIYRQEAEVAEWEKSVSNLTGMANSAIDPEVGKAARLALGSYLNEKAASTAKIEAERKWAETVASLRDNGKDVEAELSIMQHDTPDVFDSMVDTQTVRAMIMRKIEEAGTNVKDRNWLLWVTDAIMYMIPFGTTAAHSGVYEAKKKDITDFILSGRRTNDEANNFWNAALNARTNDEKQAIVDQVWEGVNKNVTTWLGPNELLRLQMLHEYNVTPSASDINILDAMQNLPTVAMIGYKSFTTPFKLARSFQGFGASGKSASIIEDIAKYMQENGPEATMAKYGMSIEEIEDALTPSALNGKSQVALSVPEKYQKRYADLTNLMDEAETAGDTGRFNELSAKRDLLVKNAPPDVGYTPIPDPSSLPLSTADRLERGRLLFNNLMGGKLLTVTRLSDEEKTALLTDLVNRAKTMGVSRKNPRVVTDQTWTTETLENGSEVHRVTMTVGRSYKKGESPWYASRIEANKARAKLGIRRSEARQVGPDQWGVNIEMPIDEQGKSLVGAKFFMPLADKEKAGPFSFVARFIGGGNVAGSEELKGAAQLSFDKRNKINSHIRERILPRFYKLNKDEQETLSAILAKGEQEGVWYDDKQLYTFYKVNYRDGKNFAKFKDAYAAAEEINDIEYYLRNVNELVELHSQGYQLINFHGLPLAPHEQGINGKVFRAVNAVPPEAIWDMESGEARVQAPTNAAKTKATAKYAKDNRLSLEEINKRLEKGDVIVRLQHPATMADGSKIRFFIMRGTRLDIQPLSFQQVPYHAGGHRMYRTSYFPKKAVTGKQPWGEEYFDSPFVPTSSLTLSEAKEWSESMNIVQQAYKAAQEEGISGDDLIKAVADKIESLDSDLGYPPADEFVQWMEKYGSEHPFEAVYDREMPSLYAGKQNGVGGNNWEDSMSGTNTYLQTQGRMYTSSKGPILRNIRDWSKVADVYDPFTNLNTALSQIARMSSFTDFKIRSIQKWISTYGHALDKEITDNVSPMKLFLEGKFKTGTKDLQSIKAAAELQRAYIKRILGWKSDFDLGVENSTRQVIEWVAGVPENIKGAPKNMVSTWSKATHSVYDWVQEKKPLNAAMGLAFDATMGLFNISQYPLQYQTSFAAASIDVTKGGQAMANLPWVHLYMRKAGDEKTLEWLVERGAHKFAGFEDPKDYMDMMRTLKQSGWGNNMLGAMKNEFGPNAALGAIGQGLDTFRRTGRFFTNLAEEQNRYNAWQMAWRMTREKFPNMDTSTPLFIERVRKMAGSLSLNMDEAGAAAWQRNGLARIPTQFMPYMFRWHEVLWDKNFTIQQKLRFVTGQAFLYGTAGLPFAAWFFQEQEKNTGKTPKIGTIEGTLDRGFADTLIWYATGADVTFSERAGIGAYPTDIIEELLGGGRYAGSEGTSAFELMTGASGQIWGQFLDSSYKAMIYSAMETGGDSGKPLTEASLKRAARSISSLNNILKAEAIFNYGQFTNRKGEAISDDLPSVYGFAALLGMAPAELQEQTAQMGYLEKRKDRVNEWVEQFMIQRTKYGQAAQSGNYAEMDAIAEDINFISKALVPKDIKEEVLNKVYQDPRTRTVAEQIAERYEKEKQNEFRKAPQ